MGPWAKPHTMDKVDGAKFARSYRFHQILDWNNSTSQTQHKNEEEEGLSMAMAASFLHQPVFPKYPFLLHKSQFISLPQISSLPFPSRFRASSAVALEPVFSPLLCLVAEKFKDKGRKLDSYPLITKIVVFIFLL